MADDRRQRCPVAVVAFDGNVGDPSTLPSQIIKIKGRFSLERVVLVGDRGMITEARVKKTIKPADLDWIMALRAPAIRSLVAVYLIRLLYLFLDFNAGLWAGRAHLTTRAVHGPGTILRLASLYDLAIDRPDDGRSALDDRIERNPHSRR